MSTMFRQPKDWPPYRHEGPAEPMTVEGVADIERRFPALVDDGRKAAAVRARFGVTMTRYTQRLNALLDDPAFIELAPVRARILRQRRERARKSRRAA